EFWHVAVVGPLVDRKAVHRRNKVLVTKPSQPRRRHAALKIRLMARLALRDCFGRRGGSSGSLFYRPGLRREIGGDLAKVFLRKTLGDRRHDRVLPVTASVVVQLLDEIALLLTPDDGHGFWIGGYSALSVTCPTDLRLCFYIVGTRQ